MLTTPGSALPPAAAEALRRGNKIEAIKIVRQATGMGLAEAKAFVEAAESGAAPAATLHAARHHPHASGLSPGQVAPSGGGKWVVVVLAIVAAALGGYFFGRS